MSAYSEQAQKLAEQLAEKAANNLRRSGRTVVRNVATGRYIVSSKGRGEAIVHKKHGSDAGNVHSKSGSGGATTPKER